MKALAVILALLTIFHISGFAQNAQRSDSLLLLLNSNIDQSTRFDVLRRISRNHPNRSEGLRFAKEALSLATELGNAELIANAYEEISLNERALGNSIKSHESSLQALSIFESLGDETSAAATLSQLGSNAMLDGDYVNSVEYLKNAIAIYTNTEEHANHSLSLLNLGEAYRLLPLHDSAVYFTRQALGMQDQVVGPEKEILIAYGTGNLGMIYNALDQLDQAKPLLEEAVALTLDLGDPYSSSVYQADLGQLLAKEGLHKQAEAAITGALATAKQEGLKEQIRDFSAMLVAFYSEQDNYQKALAYQQLYQLYQDSLVNKENVQAVERLMAGYEIEKRESEISLLNAINTRQLYLALSLGAGFLLISVFSAVIYRNRQKVKRANVQLAQQKEVISQREQEKALLLKELNHRVKNNLQMVSSLLNLQENQLVGHPAEAAIAAGKYRVEALSLIHRKLYREDHHTDIQLDDYIEELVLNLCHSYGNIPKVDLSLERVEINIDMAVPVALIVNELVTNALKYAFKGVQQPKLTVDLLKNNNSLTLIIADNGVGLPEDTESTSFGMSLVHSLVEQLRGSIRVDSHMNGASHINDPQVGTSWTLTLSLKSSLESHAR